MTFPTGAYDNLRTAIDGLGAGSYTLKEGILAQSLFDSWGHHPMRFRFYAEAYEPVASVSLRGISSYGTYQAHDAPRLAAQAVPHVAA